MSFLCRTSVPQSFILARDSSRRFPCSTPELTRGIGISLQITNTKLFTTYTYSSYYLPLNLFGKNKIFQSSIKPVNVGNIQNRQQRLWSFQGAVHLSDVKPLAINCWICWLYHAFSALISDDRERQKGIRNLSMFIFCNNQVAWMRLIPHLISSIGRILQLNKGMPPLFISVY